MLGGGAPGRRGLSGRHVHELGRLCTCQVRPVSCAGRGEGGGGLQAGEAGQAVMWCWEGRYADQARPAGHHVLGGGAPGWQGQSGCHVHELGERCAGQARPAGHLLGSGRGEGVRQFSEAGRPPAGGEGSASVRRGRQAS